MKFLLAWLVIFLMSLSAHAATLMGDTDKCLFLSGSAMTGVEMRDAGMSWDVAALQVDGAIERAMGQPTSIVQDEDDAAFVRKTFKYVWESGDDIATVATNVYESCMKTI